MTTPAKKASSPPSEETTAPWNIDESVYSRIRSFSARHHRRPLVLVSSGGTSADLDGVRSVENFSTGERGARSVERFLAQGYAVVHLWRTGSAEPYSWRLGAHPMDTLLRSCRGDDIDDDNDDIHLFNVTENGGENASLHERSKLILSGPVAEAMQLHRRATRVEGTLTTLPFTSVEDYLTLLRTCGEALSARGPTALLYAAAAVSDYWIDPSKRAGGSSAHPDKIQSGQKSLQITLDPVPKALGAFRREWAPEAYCVSFKLETDRNLLEPKMKGAIDKYGVHMVVGNLLHNRRKVVYVMHPKDGVQDGFEIQEIYKNDQKESVTLEDALVDRIIQAHFQYLSTKGASACLPLIEIDNGRGGMYEYVLNKGNQLYHSIRYVAIRDAMLQIMGSFIGMVISYKISAFMQKRIGS